MKIVDLTLDIYDGMATPLCDWHPRTEIMILGRIGLEGRMSRKITLGSHTGTHVDGPIHVVQDGLSVDRLQLETLVGKARLIDMSHKGALEGITKDELQKYDIREGERIVIRTDWSDKWDTRDYYSMRPYIEADAIEWLAKRISLLGLDICAPGDPRAFLESGVLPLKIRGGDGAPARVIAIED